MEKLLNGYRALKELFADKKLTADEVPAFLLACADIVEGITSILGGFINAKGKGKLGDVADAFKLSAKGRA